MITARYNTRIMSHHNALESDLPKTVAIVGVGLIGGSIAATLKKRQPECQVLGVGRNIDRLQGAVKAGLIDEGTTKIADAATRANLLIFCTPVDRIADEVREAANHCQPGTLMTDAGSVKGSICRELSENFPENVTFIGSHPLAGSEKQGYEHAQADLLPGRVCIVSAEETTPQAATRRIIRFWQFLGMTVIEKSAGEHDQLLAMTSHLPHLIAAALAGTLDESTRPFAATGFRDTTRIAGSDPALWAAIFNANTQAILSSLDQFQGQLEEFRKSIEQQDWPRLQNLLQSAKTNRDLLDQ